MIDIWKNNKNYYQEIIDLEKCYCRDFGDKYQLEISGWRNKKVNLYLWLNKSQIVGTYLNVPKELFLKYEQKLVDECIKNNNKDYRNDYETILLKKAYKILEEKNEKVRVYRVKEIIKQLMEEEIEKEVGKKWIFKEVTKAEGQNLKKISQNIYQKMDIGVI